MSQIICAALHQAGRVLGLRGKKEIESQGLKFLEITVSPNLKKTAKNRDIWQGDVV